MCAAKKEQLSLPFGDSDATSDTVLTEPENADVSFKKGQHVVCRYDGENNGDLVLGKVESVRTNGDVLLRNLLNNGRAVKSHKVLVMRNKIVPKKVAEQLLRLFVTTADTVGPMAAKRAVRKEAISIAATTVAASEPAKSAPKEAIITFYVLWHNQTWTLNSVPLLPLKDTEDALILRARQILEERLKASDKIYPHTRCEVIGPVKSIEL